MNDSTRKKSQIIMKRKYSMTQRVKEFTLCGSGAGTCNSKTGKETREDANTKQASWN